VPSCKCKFLLVHLSTLILLALLLKQQRQAQLLLMLAQIETIIRSIQKAITYVSLVLAHSLCCQPNKFVLQEKDIKIFNQMTTEKGQRQCMAITNVNSLAIYHTIVCATIIGIIMVVIIVCIHITSSSHTRSVICMPCSWCI